MFELRKAVIVGVPSGQCYWGCLYPCSCEAKILIGCLGPQRTVRPCYAVSPDLVVGLLHWNLHVVYAKWLEVTSDDKMFYIQVCAGISYKSDSQHNTLQLSVT